MEIGKFYTREQIDEFAKENNIREKRIKANGYIIGRNDDYVFTKVDDTHYQLVSTFDQRVEDMGKNPTIFRKESKGFKSYYDNRKA